jgi:hypothetical protein
MTDFKDRYVLFDDGIPYEAEDTETVGMMNRKFNIHALEFPEELNDKHNCPFYRLVLERVK